MKEIDAFFAESFAQAALYQSFRSIASYVDGLKPSSRKVVHTLRKLNVTEPTKVARLSSRVSEETEYLHGEGSLEGVIVNLAQNFVGANNENLLLPEGNFGTRFIQSAAAGRYIFTAMAPIMNKLFKSEDDPILQKQEFEGAIIEPRFFLPILPLLLINGSEGVGTGYAQKILPRNPDEIRRELKAMMKNPSTYKPKELIPWFRGFKGKVFRDENGSTWVIQGILERIHTTKLRITEVPIGYTLASYREVLETLVENRVIKDFEDLSENDNFLFEISCSRDFSSQEDDKLLSIFKLEKRMSENFTCVDENNKIKVFTNDTEILTSFYHLRLEYMSFRKTHLLELYHEEFDLLSEKHRFIKAYIDGSLKIVNRKRAEIIADLEALSFKKIKDSYDYLVGMALWSLSQERLEELTSALQKKMVQISELQGKSLQKMWEEDLLS
jgi:DNA topoisomerase-2